MLIDIKLPWFYQFYKCSAVVCANYIIFSERGVKGYKLTGLYRDIVLAAVSWNYCVHQKHGTGYHPNQMASVTTEAKGGIRKGKLIYVSSQSCSICLLSLDHFYSSSNFDILMFIVFVWFNK